MATTRASQRPTRTSSIFFIDEQGGAPVFGCITPDPTGAACKWVKFAMDAWGGTYYLALNNIPPINLTGGDGPKTLYAFAKDAANNTAVQSGTVWLMPQGCNYLVSGIWLNAAPYTGALVVDK